MDSTAGIADILKPDALTRLRAAYHEDDMTRAISGVLPAQYPATREYVDAIGHALYPLKSEAPSPLAAADRERCLITLLASRGAKRNLAIHVYMGLMAGIPAREICHIVLLVGAYAGVETVPGALAIAQATFETLRDLVPAGPPYAAVDVLKALAAKFPM